MHTFNGIELDLPKCCIPVTQEEASDLIEIGVTGIRGWHFCYDHALYGLMEEIKYSRSVGDPPCWNYADNKKAVKEHTLLFIFTGWENE